MKDTYFRHKRKLPTGSPSTDKPVKWSLYQSLSFLDKVKHERSSKNTLDFDESQMSEIESEPVEVSESILDADDNIDSDDGIFTPSTSRASHSGKANNKSNPSIRESENASTTSFSRCSSAASFTPTLSSNTKRFRKNDTKDSFLKSFEERAQKRTELLAALHERTQPTELDEIDLFMKSISLTVKKLPQPLINEAKLGILTLVTNLESRAVSSSTTQASQYGSRTNNNPLLRDYFTSYSQQPLTAIPNSEFPETIESPDIDHITLQQI